jgi:RNA polymerase sigma-70 factor, ECF subfamily
MPRDFNRNAYKNRKLRCFTYRTVNEPRIDNQDWRERLYEAQASNLILYGRALGLSHGEAEDVLQELFVALLQKEEPPGRPEHYCVRAFRNRALNYKRGLWRRISRELESRTWFESSAPRIDLERAAMECMKQLPVLQREVIVLKIWHRYTFEEIGEVLDASPNTVAGRYRYGIEKLRTVLSKRHHEPEELYGGSVALLGAAIPIGES